MKKSLRRVVGCLLINSENKILIGYSPRDEIFVVPQGGIEYDENPRDTLKRELFEELDIKIEDKDIIKKLDGEFSYIWDDKTINRITKTTPKKTEKYYGQKVDFFVVKYDEKRHKINPKVDIESNMYEFDKNKMFWINLDNLDSFDFSIRKKCYKDAFIEFYKNN